MSNEMYLNKIPRCPDSFGAPKSQRWGQYWVFHALVRVTILPAPVFEHKG